jgi:hypothetical protein
MATLHGTVLYSLHCEFLRNFTLSKIMIFILANDANRVRKLNGVTQRDGVSGATGGGTPPVLKPPSLSDRTGKSSNTGLVDDEGYWREVKAIIGGVLGFWGGVGGLGTMFLVIVLSQRYCCKKDDGKHDDGDG